MATRARSPSSGTGRCWSGGSSRTAGSSPPRARTPAPPQSPTCWAVSCTSTSRTAPLEASRAWRRRCAGGGTRSPPASPCGPASTSGRCSCMRPRRCPASAAWRSPPTRRPPSSRSPPVRTRRLSSATPRSRTSRTCRPGTARSVRSVNGSGTSTPSATGAPPSARSWRMRSGPGTGTVSGRGLRLPTCTSGRSVRGHPGRSRGTAPDRSPPVLRRRSGHPRPARRPDADIRSGGCPRSGC